MIEEPPPPSPARETPGAAEATSPYAERPDGTVLIDLTRLVPPPQEEACDDEVPDPFQPGIVVCDKAPRSPRLGPVIGPVDDGFGSAIPRARIRLSDRAEAEANLAKTPVGGFDADGAEVRVKIDF